MKLHKLILAEEKKDGIPVMQTVIYNNYDYFKYSILSLFSIVLVIDGVCMFDFPSVSNKKYYTILFTKIAKFCLVSFCWSSHDK